MGPWGGGRRVDGAPPLGFCSVLIFWKDLSFDRKPLISALQDEIYMLWVVAQLKPVPSSWILPKVEIIKNRRKIKVFMLAINNML